MTTNDDVATTALTKDMLAVIERVESADDPQILALFRLLAAGFDKEFADND